MAYEVKVLYNGYSKMEDGVMKANCTCTLIKGPTNMIVDTMTAWDKDKILSGKFRVDNYSIQYINPSSFIIILVC